MVVEKICSVPGLGKLLINSILSNDYNIILACSFLYAAMYIFMMLIIDISYGIIAVSYTHLDVYKRQIRSN